VTPASFAGTIRICWPAGPMPKLADQLGEIAIVRSMRSGAGALAGATWTQIGATRWRLGNIAPNIGSVVAIEKDKERRRPGVPHLRRAQLQRGGGPGYFPPCTRRSR
jgi:hypothetical protein